MTAQSTEVTIERGPGFGSGTLSGAKTVGTVLGVASFADLALSAPGTYSLQASSAGLVPATSTTFRVDTVAAFCEDDVSCARSTSFGTTKLDVTALSAAGSPDAGFLTLSFNAGPSIDCAGYEEVSADTALVDFSSANRTKQATLTFDKKAMALTPNNGAAFLELCFGSPQPFPTKAGGVSVPAGELRLERRRDGRAGLCRTAPGLRHPALRRA